MTRLARNFSGETDRGSPNAHHSFGIRNSEMNYTNGNFVPTGPRSYQGNGRSNYNGNSNQRNNANTNHSRDTNGNGNGNKHWRNNNRKSNGNGNGNQWNNHNGNVNGSVDGTVNSNVNGHWNNTHNNNTGNRNGNQFNNAHTGNANGTGVGRYKGKNFNPNYKGKNFNPNFSRAAPRHLPPTRSMPATMPVPNSNIDVEMADAPSNEPNDIEMPDAPPLLDPRIEAFTVGALAIKQMAENMLGMARELDPNYAYISQQWDLNNSHISQMDPNYGYIPN